MIVVDANVLVYALVQLPQTPLAQQVAALDPDWVAPLLWRFEFTSAVTTLVRGSALNVAQAETAIREAEQLMAGRDARVDQTAAFRAAMTYNLSAYDGQYVALAEQLRIHCVTADARMLRNAQRVVISLADFVSRKTSP